MKIAFIAFIKNLSKYVSLSDSKLLNNLIITATGDECYTISNTNKLMHGKRPIPRAAKENSLTIGWKDRLTEYLNTIIVTSNLKEIMKEFGLDNVQTPNKAFFIDALCQQFHEFMAINNDFAENIVCSRYNELSLTADTVDVHVIYSKENYELLASRIQIVESELDKIKKSLVAGTTHIGKTLSYIKPINSGNIDFIDVLFLGQDNTNIKQEFLTRCEVLKDLLLQEQLNCNMRFCDLKHLSHFNYCEVIERRAELYSIVYYLYFIANRLKYISKLLKPSETNPNEYYYIKQQVVMKQET